MPAPETAPPLAAEVDAATRSLDRSLRRLHLTRTDRRAVVADVRADLLEAATQRVPPEALLGPDVDAFAREAVASGGYVAQPRDSARSVVAGLLGLGVGLALGFWLVFWVAWPFFTSRFDLVGHHPEAGLTVAVSGLTLAALLGAVVTLAVALRGRPAAGATLVRVVPMLVLVSVGVVGVGVPLLGAEVAWPVSDEVVVATAALVLVLLVTAPVVAARRWALAASAARGSTSTATA
ncbi:hypothetical protein [Pseudokineococcus sp. 1T1Z-3]|uniref:hypothetical protein n=1 Tax=Pseudokineococcus sp. 1T1Z-3 TaxID=3132745 RepID=UPI0030A9C3C3